MFSGRQWLSLCYADLAKYFAAAGIVITTQLWRYGLWKLPEMLVVFYIPPIKSVSENETTISLCIKRGYFQVEPACWYIEFD